MQDNPRRERESPNQHEEAYRLRLSSAHSRVAERRHQRPALTGDNDMQLIIEIGKSGRTVRASAGSLHGVVLRLARFLRRYMWCMWLGGAFSAAGWKWNMWQFYVAYVPVVLMLAWRDWDKPQNVQGQPPGPAAADARFVSEPDGWPRLAAPPGSAIRPNGTGPLNVSVPMYCVGHRPA